MPIVNDTQDDVGYDTDPPRRFRIGEMDDTLPGHASGGGECGEPSVTRSDEPSGEESPCRS